MLSLLPVIFVNTMQYPRTLNNNIYHLKKREPPPFLHSDINTWPRSGPFCWQNPWSGCSSGTDLVVFLENFLEYSYIYVSLFILSTHVAQMLLTPRWVNRRRDMKQLTINILRLTVGVKHSILSPNLHLVEEENLEWLPILQH